MKEEINRASCLYDFSIVLMVIRTILSNSKFDIYLGKIDGIIIGIIIILLFAKISKQKYQKREFIIIAIGRSHIILYSLYY